MNTHNSFPVVAAFPLAALVAASSLGGIVLPSSYARESASWAAQGVGQDWVNLVLVVPWLVLTGVGSGRGSRKAFLLLCGALVYTLYSYVIYAFAVHFNALFLVYCAVLGLSFFALVSAVAIVAREDVRSWYQPDAPVRLAAGLQIGIAVIFAALWLADVIPALVSRTLPAGLAELGLLTNPVHVLDLSVLLPALAVGGVSLLRRRSLGYFLGPVMLTFAVLMAIAIAGMILMMSARGIPADLTVAGVLGGLSGASALVLVSLLRRVRPARAAGSDR
jgi:hypothetical protein